jgi:hypothetical protein
MRKKEKRARKENRKNEFILAILLLNNKNKM